MVLPESGTASVWLGISGRGFWRDSDCVRAEWLREIGGRVGAGATESAGSWLSGPPALYAPANEICGAGAGRDWSCVPCF